MLKHTMDSAAEAQELLDIVVGTFGGNGTRNGSSVTVPPEQAKALGSAVTVLEKVKEYRETGETDLSFPATKQIVRREVLKRLGIIA